MVFCRIITGFWFAVLAAAILLPIPAMAKSGQSGARTVLTTSWVEEWDPAAQRWVRVEENAGLFAGEAPVNFSAAITPVPAAHGMITSEIITPAPAQLGFVPPLARTPGVSQSLAQYGPFRVLDETRAALVGSTDVSSPRQFDAMLRDYPGLIVIEMVDAPGTSHDLANLALGRKIRAAGLETHVPAGGSVRSGAVELFLAGKRQTIAAGATFAVHSWLDTRGLEPRHFAEDAPENRLYLDYYEEMGMVPDHARAFYAMTNSVPHAGALWLDANAMQRWIEPMAAPEAAAELAPVVLASATLSNEPSQELAKSAIPLLQNAAIDGAQWAWQALVQSRIEFANIAELPLLAYADVAPVMLARLDSSIVFP
jgi:hypothetical protein